MSPQPFKKKGHRFSQIYTEKLFLNPEKSASKYIFKNGYFI